MIATDRGASRRRMSGARVPADGEAQIVAELHAVEGKPADLGGYYLPDADKVAAVMRPSGALNAIIG